MTIQVNLPDGSVVNFPDDTPQAEMESALAAHTGPGPASQQALAGMQSEPQQFAGNAVEQKRARRAARIEEEFNAQPGWKRGLTTLVDLPSLMAQGGSVGLLDKAAALARAPFTDKTYEEELRENRRQTEEARARQGWAGTAAEVTGAIGSGNLLTKLGVKGLTKVAPAVATTRVGAAFAPVVAGAPKAPLATRVANTGIRTALGIGESAAYGATNAYGADEDIGKGAAMGGLFGAASRPIANLVTGGVSKVAGAFNKNVAAPTLAKLNTVKEGLYDIAERAGVLIKPEGMKKILDDAEATFTQYDSELQTGAAAVLRKIRERQGQPLTLKGLDEIRKMAGNAYQGPMAPNAKTNNTAVSELVKHIDDLIEGADPNFIAGVETEVGTKALKAARAVAHRSFKLDTAQKLVKRGEQQAARNITDTAVKSVKTQVANIIDPFKGWGRGFTAAEKAAAEKAAAYTYPQKTMHGLSSLNPFGGGKGTFMANAIATAPSLYYLGLPGLGLQAAAGVGGYAAGKYGERLAKKSVNEFLDIVARGGVPAPQIENAVQKMAKSKQDAVRRALMLGMNNQYNQPAER